MQVAINTSLTTVIFTPPPATVANAAAPTDLAVYLNGATYVTTPTLTRIAGTLAWTLTFPVTSTGNYTVFAYGQECLRFEGVNRLSSAILEDLRDEALGSWQWNKASGVMTMLRDNGTVLATFTVVDNLTTSSREKA